MCLLTRSVFKYITNAILGLRAFLNGLDLEKWKCHEPDFRRFFRHLIICAYERHRLITKFIKTTRQK